MAGPFFRNTHLDSDSISGASWSSRRGAPDGDSTSQKSILGSVLLLYDRPSADRDVLSASPFRMKSSLPVCQKKRESMLQAPGGQDGRILSAVATAADAAATRGLSIFVCIILCLEPERGTQTDDYPSCEKKQVREPHTSRQIVLSIPT